jgi:two-component system response regulator
MSGRERSILFIEDNPDDIELTLHALSEHGVRNPIIVANNGAEGLEKLAQMTELPVVVLLDLSLPKLGGIEVLQRIRANARTRLLPVIILTSSSEERDLIDSYHFGANSYVRKPVDFEEFHQAARQLSVYWLLINEPPPFKPAQGAMPPDLRGEE